MGPRLLPIAFTCNRKGSIGFRNDIYTMDADGTNVVNLTKTRRDDSQTDWSPDGTRIAFASEIKGNTDIYVMNADGTGQTNLTNMPGLNLTPSWSPDGSWEHGRESRLHILDISDLSAIREISTVDFDDKPLRERGWAHDLEIRGDLVYSTWLKGGVQVIDITDPANPVKAGGFLSPNRDQPWLSDVAMYGDYAVAVTVWGPGLYILR